MSEMSERRPEGQVAICKRQSGNSVKNSVKQEKRVRKKVLKTVKNRHERAGREPAENRQ